MNKIKNLAIFTIISIYTIGIVLTFSGELLNQIQVIRHQNQIEKISSAKTLEFSLNDWNNFSDFNEIKFGNHFYDIISYEKFDSKIVAKVVKDKFENETRVTLAKIFSKAKSPLTEKKKSNLFSKHILSKIKIVCSNKMNLFDFKLQKFDGRINSKTSTFINFQEKPPC